MRVGLVDVDNWQRLGNCFPNLALMKISAWHKRRGDEVAWYEPLFSGRVDKCYASKVFSFSPDYPFPIDAAEVERGGSGYAIRVGADGKEAFDASRNRNLPPEVEHIMPDYSLYGITDTSYGFCSRGCPRGCPFCHVAAKEGRASVKVADLAEFWSGQKNIELLDPNTLACREWPDILAQLAESGAWVNFNQGVDIRLMTDKAARAVAACKVKRIHFAFDRWQDRDIVKPRLAAFKDATGWNKQRVSVFVLCGFDTEMDQDIDRIMFIRSLGFSPYVTIYRIDRFRRGHPLLKLRRWVNNNIVFWRVPTFADYLAGERQAQSDEQPTLFA